jgi:hypothetical protein
MGLSAFDESQAWTDLETVHDASTTDPVEVTAQGVFSGRLDQLIVTSDDTVDHTISVVALFNGVDPHPLGTIAIPAGSGTISTVPPVDVVAGIDALKGGLVWTRPWGFGFQIDAPATAGKHLWITAMGGIF